MNKIKKFILNTMMKIQYWSQTKTNNMLNTKENTKKGLPRSCFLCMEVNVTKIICSMSWMHHLIEITSSKASKIQIYDEDFNFFLECLWILQYIDYYYFFVIDVFSYMYFVSFFLLFFLEVEFTFLSSNFTRLTAYRVFGEFSLQKF